MLLFPLQKLITVYRTYKTCVWTCTFA